MGSGAVADGICFLLFPLGPLAWSARLVRLVQGHGRAGRIGLEARFDVESGKSGSKFQEFRVIRRNASIRVSC